MSVPKSLWASIQGEPVFMRRVNGWARHLLDRHDPHLDVAWVADLGGLRLSPVTMGAGVRALVSLASGPR